MKKSILFLAMLLCSLAASATTHNASSGLSWLVAGEDSPVQPGDTIILADGEYVEQWSIAFQKSDLVVMAAEGAKPVVKASSYMKHYATTTFIGITFDGQNAAEYASYSYENTAKSLTFINCEFKNYTKYTISASSSAHVDSLIFENCVLDGSNTTLNTIYAKGTTNKIRVTGTEIKDYKEHGIKLSDAACVDALIVTNSLIHDCAYTAIQIPAASNSSSKQSCSSIELTNSTIYNIGDNTKDYGAVDIRDNANIASTQTVLIDHVTLYNFTTKDWYGGFMIYKSANATISNCIASNPDDIYSKSCNPFHAYAGATVSNCIYYNTNISSESTATYTTCEKADPMFVDAANGDFMLYAESPAIGLGDPRWGVKASLRPGSGKLKEAVEAAQPGDVIVLGDETYEVSSSIDFDVEGLTIKAAEGTKPIIKTTDQWTELKISASTTFEGITFDGGDLTKVSVSTFGTTTQTLTLKNCEFKNYTDCNVNIASETSINTIAIENCVFDGGASTPNAIYSKGIATTCTIEDTEFKNYTTHCISAGDYYRGRFDNLSINNCLFHDSPVAVYMPKYADEGDIQTCANFSLTNSTIYNMVGSEWKAVIDLRSNPEAEEALNKVVIDHITLYNFTTTELGGITSRKSTDAKITNSIIANPADNTNQYAYRVYGAAAVQNTLCFNTKRSGGNSSNSLDLDPLFVDAANGNFDIYANSPAVGKGSDMSNLGDTRWGVSASLKGKVINIEPGQAQLNSAVGYSVNAGDTIVLKDGIYEEPWTFNLDKEGLVIMAAENAKPIIKLTNVATVLNIQATTTFNGITFDAGNVANYILATTEATSGTLTITNCEFKNWAYWAISNKSETAASIEAVIIDNCLFHDGAEAAIYFSQKAPEGKHACNYFKMTNSTIYNVKSTKYAGIVHVSSNAEAEGMQNKVIIDHVTMYNLDGADLGIIAVRKSSDLTISNTIIANPAAGERASYVYGGVAEKVIYFNVSQDGDLTYTNCLTDDPLFVDAANANFMLSANSPAVGAGTNGSNLGDPRWGVAEPAFITLTTGNNDAVIAANIGKTVDVVIERSFTANDGYYTLCVPFNMPASVIGKAYSLGTITEHVSGQGININLKEENELSAGMPYLVLPKANMSELIVENVTIAEDDIADQNITNEELNVQIFFQGYYSAPAAPENQTNGTTQYYVGNNGYLYNDVVDIRGLCGLFTITDTEGNPAKVRARVVTREDAATGFENITNGENTTIKLIENGQLIIIRNGEKFNVQGQRLKANRRIGE